MTLHPQAIAALELWKAGPSVADAGFGAAEIAERRDTARADAQALGAEPVAEVIEIDAGGVPATWYRPVSGGAGAVVYAHGGGFVFGDAVTSDGQARRLANRLGRSVLSVDYRRPPEDPFPAAADDVAGAARWLGSNAADLGIDGTDLVTMGDSAGANLALVSALRNPGLFSRAVLVYPFIDPRCRGESFETEARHGLTEAEATWLWKTYAGPDYVTETGLDPTLLADPDFCPLDAPEVVGLPPTQILVAEHDILRDEGLLLAERIAAGGVRVQVDHYPGLIHGFWTHPELFDAAEQALADTAGFLAVDHHQSEVAR